MKPTEPPPFARIAAWSGQDIGANFYCDHDEWEALAALEAVENGDLAEIETQREDAWLAEVLEA